MTDRWGAIVGLLVIAFVVWKIWSEFSRANRGSAENALFTEIVMQLKNWPPHTPYPGSLSELRLTYPDGDPLRFSPVLSTTRRAPVACCGSKVSRQTMRLRFHDGLSNWMD